MRYLFSRQGAYLDRDLERLPSLTFLDRFKGEKISKISIFTMSFTGEKIFAQETVKTMPEELVRIYCFICSAWTNLKIVRTTMTSGLTHFQDACTGCDANYAYTPFTCTEMNDIENSLKKIGVTRRQTDDIITMISSNKNTKYHFNQSFGSVYTAALLYSVQKREKSDENEECPICLDLPESKKELKCSHIVCESCYKRMNKERCPFCRCFFEWNGDNERFLF